MTIPLYGLCFLLEYIEDTKAEAILWPLVSSMEHTLQGWWHPSGVYLMRAQPLLFLSSSALWSFCCLSPLLPFLCSPGCLILCQDVDFLFLWTEIHQCCRPRGSVLSLLGCFRKLGGVVALCSVCGAEGHRAFTWWKTGWDRGSLFCVWSRGSESNPPDEFCLLLLTFLKPYFLKHSWNRLCVEGGHPRAQAQHMPGGRSLHAIKNDFSFSDNLLEFLIRRLIFIST